MSIVYVTKGYRITVPKDVRKEKNIKAGDKFVVTVTPGGIVLSKPADVLGRCFGAWGPGESGVAYARKIRDNREREKRLGIR